MIVKDFLAEFDKSLLDFSIEAPADTYLELGKQIMDTLTQYQPLRDDYLEFIHKLFRDDRNFDVSILVRFFEHLPLQLSPRTEGPQLWKSTRFEHYKLINHKLFIYTIAIALKHENYRVLEELLLTRYFFKESRSGRPEQSNYEYLRTHFSYLDQHYKAIIGRTSDNVHAEVVMSRVPDFLERYELVAGDLFCYLIGQLHDIDWFPMTYGYNSRNARDFEFFYRLVSKRHFEKVKALLGVETVEEFKVKLTALINKVADPGYANYRGRIPSIGSYVSPETVASQI